MSEAVTESDRKVTFRDLFGVREYRALYLSLIVNWVGDYLARAAITVLVYEESKSVLMSAAAFAVSFLPWVVGGPLLSALAERYPYRRVLITADLFRMVVIAMLLIPGVPIPVMLLLVFLASLGTPPTQAARSALQPLVVGRDKLPIAVATNATTVQAAQVFGYMAGAALATAINPQVALAIDVVTFAVSAALIAWGVQPRPAAHDRSERRHLLRESGEGFQLVFGTATLRSIAIMVFVLTMFAVVPEGLAAAWAAESDPDSATRGLDQGLIMAAGPIGFVVGGLLISRLAGPELRDRLVRPLAVLAALVLVPALAGPPAPVVAVLVALSGIAQGGITPTLNARFVLILPHGYRARAYGVMQTGMQLSQFAAVMVTGLLADHFWLPLVVGLWSVGGAVAMGVLAASWPSREAFTAATEQASPEHEHHGRHRAAA
ncbi:MFS transporter [Paractinoplanes atraurantiacus]|uniref:Predicted arabinose efflux permease, MFS family n=1 Tax=Paractinoplanes atraurantiacus TaxID=1036182 RepID=A0A285H5T4_9ACTN|nr:MFS transporter [Actinoplanes atraurantiacus]SNY31169.1 Predicted arabinose efflux permease, MFS family [Actinoplanes atraurantiacus]